MMPKESDLEKHLAELESLRTKGVIDDNEYQTRRAAIIGDTSQPVTKKKGLPVFHVGCLSIIVLVVIVIIAVAVSTSGSKESTSSQDSQGGTPGTAAAVSTQQVKPTEPPMPSNQKQIGDLLLTVNGANLYSDELFPAEPGTHYVAVDVTAKNTGKKTYSLNVFNFHLKDSDKYSNEPALTNGPDPRIGSHDMVPGQEVRGFIVFKLGDGRDPVELQYQSFTGSTGTIPVPKP